MGDPSSGLRWQPVSARDIPAIVALYAEALAVDGGQPYAGDEALLRRWYTGGIEASLAAFDGGRLVGVCARRHASTGDGPRSVIAGQVAPGYRGRRIGARLLDAALDGADPAAGVLVENESLTGSADALYRSRGLQPVFAEDVMTGALADGGPAVARPARRGIRGSPACGSPSGAARRRHVSTRCTPPRSPAGPASPAGRPANGSSG